MNKRLMILAAMAAALLPLALSAPAQAQATRTWVSGVGDDVNPCSRTAPCKTFAGAISKTAAGGEISVLDPGGFGAVTITKSITLNGDGTLAGILNAGTNGIIINGAGVKVILRNLSIVGGTTGTNGINFLQGAEVTVDNCWISGQTNNGINMALTATSGRLFVNNTFISGVATGIGISTTAGVVQASIDRSRIYGATTQAIAVGTNGDLTVSRSVFVGNGSAIVAVVSGQAYANTSTFSYNGTAFNAGGGTTIRISDNELVNNGTNFVLGGTISSAANNRTVGGGVANPNGAAITIK